LKRCRNQTKVFLRISVTFFCMIHLCKKLWMIIEKPITVNLSISTP
jgi:hypothetical protein